MIKTALIMCGGKASRFNKRDKSLVKYRNKRIIEYLLDSLKKAGIKKVILVCNRHNHLKIEFYVKKYFTHYIIIPDPPKRFRVGIKHAECYLGNWFIFVAGNHPIEKEYFQAMIKKHNETKSWIVTLYKSNVSSENIFVGINSKSQLTEGSDFIMQHPFILSKGIINYQKRDNFKIKIEKSIKQLLKKKKIYGLFWNFPPEFDTRRMLKQNKLYLDKHQNKFFNIK